MLRLRAAAALVALALLARLAPAVPSNGCVVDSDCTARPNNSPEDCYYAVCEPASGECFDRWYCCDDGDPCTVDACGDDGTCINDRVDCDDNNLCTKDYCDDQGVCQHDPCYVDCDDNDPCTNDVCDPATGQCANPPIECPDGTACTGGVCVALCNNDLVCDPFEDAGSCPVDCGVECPDPATTQRLDPCNSASEGIECPIDQCDVDLINGHRGTLKCEGGSWEVPGGYATGGVAAFQFCTADLPFCTSLPFGTFCDTAHATYPSVCVNAACGQDIYMICECDTAGLVIGSTCISLDGEGCARNADFGGGFGP